MNIENTANNSIEKKVDHKTVETKKVNKNKILLANPNNIDIIIFTNNHGNGNIQ